MDSANRSKEFSFRSGSDREKLTEQGKSDFDAIERQAKKETAEEKENFRRFYEQRVRNAEDDMLRNPELSKRDGPALTIGGKPVQPPSVWKREDRTPQQARELRAAAEQKVGRDHETRLTDIQRTREERQQVLLDRELGPRRHDRDRSYRDVGEARPDSGKGQKEAAERSAPDDGAVNQPDDLAHEWTAEEIALFEKLVARDQETRSLDHQVQLDAGDRPAPEAQQTEILSGDHQWTLEETALYQELKDRDIAGQFNELAHEDDGRGPIP